MADRELIALNEGVPQLEAPSSGDRGKVINLLVSGQADFNDASGTYEYRLMAGTLAANRNIALPALTGSDEFTFNDHTQTLTNKTLTSPDINTPDIDGGTIDGTTQASGTIDGPIAAGGTWTAAATWTLPAFTLGGTVTSNGQSFSGTIANLGTVTTVDINGGSIDGTVIGGSSAAAGSFTTLNATGGGALTGTWSDLGTVTTVDINGGSIDGTVIGANTAAAVSVTTGDFSSIVTVNNQIDIAGTVPKLNFFDSDAGTNEKYYRFTHDSGAAFWQLVNDAYSGTSNIIRVDRTGTAIDSITYGNATDNPDHVFYGNVGIGIAPFRNLVVGDGTSSGIANIYSSNADSSILELGDTDDINVGRIEYDHANDTMNLRTSGADRLTISSSGISLDSGSNFLDTYEEGTFTPALEFGGASTGITYTTQLGVYERIGGRVFFSAYILLSNKGSSTGVAKIIGLPFSSASGNGNLSPVVYRTTNLTFTGQISGHIETGSPSMNIQDIVSGGATVNIDNNDFVNTTEILVSGHYRAA